MDPAKLAECLRKDQYGDFRLTKAIRPYPDSGVIPREGYQMDWYDNSQYGVRTPVLIAAVSRELLFDVFLELLDPLGEIVDAILETSHENGEDESGHQDLLRRQIELVVLKSTFCDFEDLLLNDGCTGVAVMPDTSPMEVQFDEHKLLVVYAHDLNPFIRILERNNIPRDDDLRFITQGEHLHDTDESHRTLFAQLCNLLGAWEVAKCPSQ